MNPIKAQLAASLPVAFRKACCSACLALGLSTCLSAWAAPAPASNLPSSGKQLSDKQTSDKQTSDKQTSDKQTSDKQTSAKQPSGKSAVADIPPAQTVTIDTPRNGWSVSGLTDRAGDTRVAYPSPPINRGAQRNRTLIEGHIKDAKAHRMPTLVANGNPMVLNTGPDGRYARHYAFGGGSNSVEIVTGDGKSAKRVQFYEARPGQLAPQLRIICSWDAPGAEVDMHIITPDGQHAFWARPVLNGGGGLDVDSVDGPGPEMFSTVQPVHGAYHVYINYWGNYGPGGYNFDESKREIPIITTRVTLVFYENTAKEKRESFVIPLRKIGDLNLVKSFLF